MDIFSARSPFDKGLDYFKSHKHQLGKCHMCATCSSLYIRNNAASIIECTENGLFINPRPYIGKTEQINQGIFDKINKVENSSLLYGSALYHTERELDLTSHMATQIQLLIEAYSILNKGSLQKYIEISAIQNNELVLYIELTHPVEKAIASDGEKITHPHVWIKTNMKLYGPPHSTIPIPTKEFSVPDFIRETVKIGTSVIEKNPSTKVYVKYYLDASSYRFKKCEIDVEKMRLQKTL